MTRLQGYLYNDAGEAIQGATVTALEAGTTTTIGSTDTTDSNGSWQFTSGLTGKNVDIKIQSGSSIRYIKHADHIQVEHIWARSDTAAGTPPARIENATNNASNMVLELVGDNSTRADGDEIYISFKMDNDAGEETEFAKITAEANDVSNGSEDGELRYSVMSGGSPTEVFVMSAAVGGGTSFDITTSTVTMATDSFTIKSEDDGSAAILYLEADQGDDNADKWRVQVADGGTMTYDSYIGGSYATHLTVTPNSTASSSNVSLAGSLTLGSVAAAGTDTDKFLVLDSSGNVDYRTGSQVLSDIGAGTGSGDITGVTAGVGLSGGGTSGGVTLTLDLSELSGVTPASGDSLSTLDSDGANEQLTTVDNLATLFAGTGLTASSAVIGVDASQAITALTGGDLTLYHDANNADVSFKMGTSATEALSIEVLNGGSNKTNEETKIMTTTASGTANHGKISIYIDEVEILDIDDGGIDLAAGMTFAVNGTDIVSATGANTALTSIYNTSLAVGYGSSHANIDFSTDNSIIFDIDGTSQIQLDDGVLKPTTDIDVDLGTSTLRYKSLYAQKFAMDASADGIADHDYSGITALLRVGDGANVGAFDLVCISDVTNEVQVADADAVATSKVIGINPSNSAISDNSEGIILLHGIVRDDDWNWTTGATLYLGTGGTGSTITASAPTGSGDCVVPIGVALEPDMIYFNPTQSIVELA